VARLVSAPGKILKIAVAVSSSVSPELASASRKARVFVSLLL
jgi:hypothetical protein